MRGWISAARSSILANLLIKNKQTNKLTSPQTAALISAPLQPNVRPLPLERSHICGQRVPLLLLLLRSPLGERKSLRGLVPPVAVLPPLQCAVCVTLAGKQFGACFHVDVGQKACKAQICRFVWLHSHKYYVDI